MKKQNTAVRRAALAVLYLAVFAAAVMYLRVTISVPAEGDDKLTLNGWLYDMGRMSFWPYALQDLKEPELLFIKAGAVLPVPLPQRGGAAVLPHTGQLPVVHHCHDGHGGFPGQPRGGKAQPQQCPGSGRLWSGAGGGSYF